MENVKKKKKGKWIALVILILALIVLVGPIVVDFGGAALNGGRADQLAEDYRTRTGAAVEKGDIRRDLAYMEYAPILFLSALTGSRVDRLFGVINDVNAQASMRISTGMLNDVLADATARVQPPTDKGKRLKVYYMTQVGVKPPHFVIFCNRAELFHFSYQRYIENQIRATFGLEGTPIRLIIRQKGDKED